MSSDETSSEAGTVAEDRVVDDSLLPDEGLRPSSAGNGHGGSDSLPATVGATSVDADPTADAPPSTATGTVPPSPAPPSPEEQSALRRKRIIAWSAFVLASIAYILIRGLPESTDVILIWITVALFISTLGDSGGRRKAIIRDWLPLYLVLAVYDLLRGYASDTFWGPFVRPQVWFDTHLFGGVAPTVQLQRWLYNPHDLHVWDYAVWITYTSHFFTSFIIAGVLWKRNYASFRRYVPLFVGLTALGYITYVLYPAMPPWLASETGHLPHTVRIIPVVWNHVGFHSAAALFTGGSRFDNNIAAMPSLHAAYPMLILLYFWRTSRPWLRVVLVAYPLAMAFSLVYTGEHFVIDIVVGWTYACVTYFVGSRLLDRWELRQQRKKAALSGQVDAVTPTVERV